MAIEIPNAFEAAGTFDGQDPPTNTNPIFASGGIQPWDPATTPANPVGGFTRIATTDYEVRLVRPIDFREGIAIVQCMVGKPELTGLCATLGWPEPDDSDDGVVFILGNGIVDGLFALGVWRFRTGTEGTREPNP